MKRRLLIALLALAAIAAVAVAALWPREQFIAASSAAAYAPTPDNIARGAYLARAGNCMACHTARGGVAYAGGRALDTPFGKLYGPNITPDRATGIGDWSADHFWNAMHNGKSRDGRLLYPAFPYTNFTKVTRADSDALFAFLHSLAPQVQANRVHELRFPYNQQVALAAWRLLYFKPAVFEADKSRELAWNRGAYLVQGLGHCSACHSTRNTLGAPQGGLTGGLIPSVGWYAPSLTSDREAGLGKWEVEQIVQLLHSGVSARATVVGPMAEVVGRSLQHLSGQDVTAMALYLKSLPQTAPPARQPPQTGPASEQFLAQGKKLYEQHCVDCHAANGQGQPPHYPPLAGNRAMTMDEPVNAIRSVLHGGFPPGTAGNPRPYGMPTFSHVLDDQQAAAVISYVRASWGNAAGPVTTTQVNANRSVPLD
jgi:mono/diheme cytochrome c family protein